MPETNTLTAVPDFSDAAQFGLSVSEKEPAAAKADFGDAGKFGLTLSSKEPSAPQADFNDAGKFGLTLLDMDPADVPPVRPPRLPAGLAGKPAATDAPAGYMGIPYSDNNTIDLAKVAKGTIRNTGDFLAATGPMVQNNPEFGGEMGAPPPTFEGNPKTMEPSQVQQFSDATNTPLVPISEGVQPGTLLHGITRGAESLTTPQNLAIAAATWPLSTTAALAAKGWDAATLKALNTGLGVYFAGRMGYGASKDITDAYHAYQQGDLDTVAEKLGTGSVEGLFALAGIYHFGSNVRNTRAATEAQAARQWQETGDQLEVPRALAGASGDPIPVTLKGPTGPRAAQIEFVSLGQDGRKYFSVIERATGNPLISGTASAISDFLNVHAADPGLIARWNQSLASDPGSVPAFPSTNATDLLREQKIFETNSPVPPAASGYSINPETGQVTAHPGAPPNTPGSSPVEPPPTKPTKTERVSPATPDAPTASQLTTPEAPETMALQLDQLAKGQRKVVMYPKGTPPPSSYPPGTAVTNDGLGNIYVYRNDLITRSEIKRAAHNNTLHELLGSTGMGMGTVDKSELQGDPITVVGRAPDGTEAQSTATDAAHLPETLAATHAVTPQGGTVSIEPPEQVISDRQGVPPVAPPSEDLSSPQSLESPVTPASPVTAGTSGTAAGTSGTAAGTSGTAAGTPAADLDSVIDAAPPAVPKGWDTIEPPPYQRHSSVDLSDEELAQRANNQPLPPPPGLPENALDAWETVSRIVPELASRVKGAGLLNAKDPANATVNVKSGTIRIHPDRELTPETLWHELIHLDQPEAQQGREALAPDDFNALEMQARAGIKEALARFEKLAKAEKRPTLEAPITYFSGAALHYKEAHAAAESRNDFGMVITPKTSHYALIHDHFKHVMVDNGVFSAEGFKEDAFRRLLDRIDALPSLKKKVQFVVAPDVMVHEGDDVKGDAEATLAQFPKWADELHKRGFPVAFVAQPGAEHMLDRIPWDKIDTLFIGGDKPWKFRDEGQYPPGSPDAIAYSKLISEAIKRGIPIHVGRVYRAKDIEHVHMNYGVKSVDSTHIGYEPSKALPFILRQLDKWNVHNENPPDPEREAAMIRREEELEAQEQSHSADLASPASIDAETQPTEHLSYRDKGNHKIDIYLKLDDEGQWHHTIDYNLQGHAGGSSHSNKPAASRDKAVHDAVHGIRRHLVQIEKTTSSLTPEKIKQQAGRMVAWLDEQAAVAPKPSQDLVAPASVESPDLAAPAGLEAPAATKSYKYELRIQGEGEKWHPNGIAFATREEAEKAGQSKFQNWMMATDQRVVESDEAPNYRWDDKDGMQRIEEKPAEATTPVDKPSTEVAPVKDLAAPAEIPDIEEMREQLQEVRSEIAKTKRMMESTASESTRAHIAGTLNTLQTKLLDLLDDAERQFGHTTAVQLSREYGDQVIPQLADPNAPQGEFTIEVYSEPYDEETDTTGEAQWHDLEEGPFDTADDARKYAESEVGVPWRVREIKTIDVTPQTPELGAPAEDMAAPGDLEEPATIEPEQPTERPTGVRPRPVRADGSTPLAGVPAEDVRGAGEDGQAAPSGVGGGGEHAGHDADAHEPTEQSPVRPGEGDSVPGVVSTSGGTRTPEVRPEPTPTRDLSGDYRLTVEQALAIETGGAKTRARANIEAIRTIKQIIAENRAATLEEQQKIAKFVGWGASEMAQGLFTGYKHDWAGLRENLRELLSKEEIDAAEQSTLNAHFTRRDMAHTMWQALKRLGFRAGHSVGEAGMGIGNFFMMMPEELLPGTSRTGIEMDTLTGAMARALFPGSNILVKPYQETNLPDNWFDAFIGNVPFANHQVVDPVFKRQPALTQNVHNYFFAKSMLKLRPGGVMMFITSRYTMDGQATAFRRWMNEQAELLGAIRLPNDTFIDNAGTTVTTDIVILRKRMAGQVPVSDAKWLESKPLKMENGEAVHVNEYYHAHPEMMMGTMKPGKQYARGYPELFGEFSLDKLQSLLNTLPADVMPDWSAETGARDELVENYPDASHIKEHGYGIVNGAVVQREGGKFKPVAIKGKKLDRMRALIELRGAAREVVRTQQLDHPEDEITKARRDMNVQYNLFVQNYGPVNLLGNALVFAADPDWPVVSGLLEDFDKDAYKAVPKAAKDKGDWDVTKDGKQVILKHGKEKYVIATKRPIFHGRTIQKPPRVEKVETAPEALAVSMNELGRMDWDRMQELTGRDPETLQKELIGQIFRNPTSKKWETADEYLSGNVRQKLADAKFIAKRNPEYQSNVEALEAVQPVWKPAGKIKASLGATWIPDTDYSQFAQEVLKVEGAFEKKVVNEAGEEVLARDLVVAFIPQTGGFAVRERAHFLDAGVANTTEFGTAYFDGMDQLSMSLNGQSPVARDTYTDMDGNEYSVKNPDETIKAVEKQEKLNDAFVKWLWSHPERAQRLENKFNTELNNLRLREYNGSHLKFPGLNKTWLRSGDPEPHQKNAVWRTIQSGNTLYAHVVGAGKTLEAIMAAMELRRLGMRRKNMMVVPNHLVQQWSDDFMRSYPGAQILVPTKKDFQKHNRQRLMARIASGNYDAVIVGHNSFGKLAVKPETYKAFIDEQLQEINDAIDAAREGLSDPRDEFKNPTIKQLRRRKASLEAKLKKKLKADEKDQGLTFEELGVDQLFVDEADLFKNLGYTTQMDRIAGLPNTDSDRATDMLLKTRFVGRLHGGDKGTVFMTGTPVSNSIAEIWTMMRYLMPNYLEREGFDQFDAWAKTFGERRTQMEVAPEGGRFIQRTRFSKFKNAAQMMAQFRLIADIKTANQLNLPTPAVYKGGYIDIVAPASEPLKEFVGNIGDRADDVRSGVVKPEDDNMLKISSDGRKASLDMRLVQPGLPDDPNSKPNKAVKQILEVYKEFDHVKGTQIVFLDLGTPKSDKVKKKAAPAEQVVNTDDEDDDIFGAKEGDEDEEEEAETADEARERGSVYDDIKRKLIAGGIPADEIAFAQEAKTDAQKQDLFDRMNSGRLRVLMGSTEKMGAGTNVQRRLVALHHLDAPWRPRDMTQRDGRIKRQGNYLYDNGLIPSVRLYRYMTEGSFDAFMWETLSAKAAPIEQLMEGDPNMDDVDELSPLVLSYEQAKAISSGSPEIREKIILDQDIHKLEVSRGAWLSEQASIAQQMGTLPSEIRAGKSRIEEFEDDITTRDANPDLVVSGKHFSAEDRNDDSILAIRGPGGQALINLLDSLGPVARDGKPINATFRGFELQTIARTRRIEARTAKGRKARSFVQESVGDNHVKYYELHDVSDVKDLSADRLMPDQLKMTALGKEEAEQIHADWEHTKGEASEVPWRSANDLAIYTTPGFRMKAASGTYAVVGAFDRALNPLAIINSLKHQTDGFDEAARYQKDQLRRLTKKHTELESKMGDGFQHEEKLQTMKRRQAELAVKLGETGDDKAALRAAEDAQTNPNNPLNKFLADPAATMHAKWFPAKKWQGTLGSGARNSVKGNLVTPILGVAEDKIGRGSSEWSVHHIPSGMILRNRFARDYHAVDYARKIAKHMDLNWTKPPEGAGEQLRDFTRQWKAPQETPEQSKERLNADPEEFYVDRAEGEISNDHSEGEKPLTRRAEGERATYVTLGFGLGALQDPLAALYRKDIVPTARKVSARLRGALDNIRKGLAPQTRGEPARKGYGLLREMGAEIDQRRDRAVSALKAYRAYFYAMPKEHGVHGLDIYDAIETGNTQHLSPTVRAFAAIVRQLFDGRYQELRALGRLDSYIEDYLPHEYKNPDDAARWVQNWLSKRPMAGSEAFRKRRVYPTMREALEDPNFTLVAKFDNPVDFVLSKLAQMDKSITAHLIFEELEDEGRLKYVPAGGKVPAGMAAIDDKIFTVFGPKRGAVKIDPLDPDKQEAKPEAQDFATPAEFKDALRDWKATTIQPEDVRVFGKREMGRYYAAEPLAAVINNHLSPGISFLDAYKIWRDVNNTLNMVSLSTSWYHGLTTTLNSSFSDMALGMKQALAGKPIEGATSVARGFVPFASIVSDFFKGTAIQKVWDGEMAAPDVMTAAIVDALKKGGGKARQDMYYSTSYTEGISKAWNQPDNPIGAAWGATWRLPFAAMELTMKPIMEYLVPRAKLGAFAKRAQLEIEQNPNMGLDEAREKFGAIWDAMDDRFGQLSQRNLMMNGIVKDLMNAVVGRPGWNIGSIRALGGGLYDGLKMLGDSARGKRPEFSDRTAFLIAMILGGAIINGLVSWLLSGKKPDELMDYVMPRDGGVTEDGRPSRIVLPTYVAKDLYSYLTRPVATLKAKASPALTIAADLLSNRNFYGQKIYGRGGVGVGNYVKSAVTPYSVQGLQKNLERGESPAKTVLPFVGVMPAGKRVGLSKAEQIITEYRDEQRANTPPAPTAHTRARAQVFQAAKSGDLTRAHRLGTEAIKEGTLTQHDVLHAIQRGKESPLINDVKTLPFNVALEVMEAATPAERTQIAPIVRKKVFAARTKSPSEWDNDTRALAAKWFRVRMRQGSSGDFDTPAAIQ